MNLKPGGEDPVTFVDWNDTLSVGLADIDGEQNSKAPVKGLFTGGRDLFQPWTPEHMPCVGRRRLPGRWYSPGY